MLLAALDRPNLPAFTRPLDIFGRVPFLFYVLHLPLLHAMAVAWSTSQKRFAPGRTPSTRIVP